MRYMTEEEVKSWDEMIEELSKDSKGTISKRIKLEDIEFYL